MLVVRNRLATKLRVDVVDETKLLGRAYSMSSCVTVEVSTGFRHLLVLPADASGPQLLQRIEAETGVPSRCSQATLCDGLTRTKVGYSTLLRPSWSETAVRCTKSENGMHLVCIKRSHDANIVASVIHVALCIIGMFLIK